MSFRIRAFAAIGVTLLVILIAVVKRPAPTLVGQEVAGTSGSATPAPQGESLTPITADAVARLQQKIDSGEVKLTFEPDLGYLRSLLNSLNIPESSQALVFSKSSAQMAGISPERPRAIYFNDDTYVGWVQEGALELTAVDPREGPFFYTLPQVDDPKPKFERHTSNCVGCHDSSEDPSRLIPRLLKLSVLPDRDGLAIQAAALATTDRSPFRERWGGWYVTGTHGRQRHMGNETFRAPADPLKSIPDYIAKLDLDRGANVTDLTTFFDTKPYLTPHSDIVALMALGHQTHVFNLMSVAIYRLKTAQEDDPNADMDGLVKELGEPIVRAMLFSGEAALTDPVAGTTSFAAEFQKRGPRDRLGRSLRDLDLKTRLLRYPLSYVIYADAFDRLPDSIRIYVARRLRDVLTGEEKAPAYAHLSADDRRAILEILEETKPGFVQLLEGRR
jgi:hypothetical protein